MKKFDLSRLIISIGVCQLAGVVGGFFTASSVDSWYVLLNKPSFNPPSWVFSPVWLTLYFLMGISLYLVWQEGFHKKHVKFALIVFLVHLALNTLWSILFFGLQSPFLAFLEIIILWFFILWVFAIFLHIKKLAAYLLLPYLFWVTFAAILNYALVILN